MSRLSPTRALSRQAREQPCPSACVLFLFLFDRVDEPEEVEHCQGSALHVLATDERAIYAHIHGVRYCTAAVDATIVLHELLCDRAGQSVHAPHCTPSAPHTHTHTWQQRQLGEEGQPRELRVGVARHVEGLERPRHVRARKGARKTKHAVADATHRLASCSKSLHERAKAVAAVSRA